jgi:hypothetical protein
LNRTANFFRNYVIVERATRNSLSRIEYPASSIEYYFIFLMMASAIWLVPTAVGSSRWGFMS